MSLKNEQNTSMKQRLNRYKKRFYLSALVKGLFISLGIILSIFLFVTLLESVFRFGGGVRAILLIVLLGTFLFSVYRFLGEPIMVMLGFKQGMSPEQAARQVGKYFPDIGDKLLNLIQLEQENASEGSLILASIEQKKKGLNPFKFEGAVDFSKSRSYAKYALVPMAIIVIIAFISPRLLPDSSKRIVQFNEDFAPAAPFTFEIVNDNLLAFKNEDFELSFRLNGETIPFQAYVVDNERRIKLFVDNSGNYNYNFPKIQRDKNIIIEAAGFTSEIYGITVVERPDLLGFNVNLEYPAYLGRQNERRANSGNLIIPEGTRVSWTFQTQATDVLNLKFGEELVTPNLTEGDKELYSYERTIDESLVYEILLENSFGSNRDRIMFEAQITPDKAPELSVEVYKDTVMFNFVAFRGDLRDDYGITALSLYTRNKTKNPNEKFSPGTIAVSNQPNQRFYHQWDLDSIDMVPGTELEFYLQVWDNDGYNGRKYSTSPIYRWKIPGEDEIDQNLERIAQKTESTLDKTLSKAQELEAEVKEAEERLRGKREMDFQDEMFLKELLEQREEMEKALEELAEQNKESLSQRDRFSKEQNEEIKKKAEQLQKLMDDLLDEETRKLYDELQRLLEEEQNLEEYRNNLEKLSRQEKNLAKELERALELFKRLKMEQKMQESFDDLSEQIEEQSELLEETKELENSSELEENAAENENQTSENSPSEKNKEKQELIEKQEDLQESFEETKDKLEEIQELNQDLKRPQSLPDTQFEQEEVERQQEKSKQSLENQNSGESQKSQSKAIQQMKEMQEKMEQMQSGMQMEVMQANMDDLRDIMHNLLTLSFDQEELINEFSEVKQSDPRFVSLGQEQLKIRDDAQIVEDSLLSLAERVFQLQAFVTREVENMTYHLDQSLSGIKERKKPNATAEQQFAMTAMNNLALLLDDVMEQMQDNMMQGQGQGQPQPMPSLGEMQEQLNQQIEGLQKSGKQGRELSEELARLAAEQERIREAFEEMQKKFGESEGGNLPGDGIPQQMEQTEIDLVNKQLTEEMIERQKDILTRMLQAEDALREQDMDEERKGETAQDYDKIKPKEFDDYFELKKQEIELLRTLPPKLYPYYKKEVNDYFNRIGNSNK